MIVRESPSPREHVSENAWPPKSPRAALVASPSGRKRLEQYYQHRQDASPSRGFKKPDQSDSAPDEGSADDEETLQLQLKAIKAKLKLKKLRKQKEASQTTTDNAVEVPSSPKRQRPPPNPAQSPRRTQLGIDKGLKASDVSLKQVDKGPRLQPSKSLAELRQPRRDAKETKRFAERLMASRNGDREEENRRREIKSNRSRAFGVGGPQTLAQKEDQSQRRSASNYEQPTGTLRRELTRLPIHAESEIQEAKHQQRQRPLASAREPSQDWESHSGFALSKRNIDRTTVDSALQDKDSYPLPRLLKEVHAPHYDPPDVPGDYVVYGIVASKSKPRDHAAPNLSTSSAPDAQPQRSKFMVLHLTDLEWELDLFLFGAGFETFWKLSVGTVIAVLNPGIMPPKPHARDTGKFSLKLGSSEDTVLEIGTSADIAFCKSVKSDGQICGQWVDGRKTEYCEFHVGLQAARSKSSRMEINTMGTLGLFSKSSDRGRDSGRGRGRRGGRGNSDINPFQGGDRGRGRENKKDSTLQGQYFDREARENAFVVLSSLSRGGGAAKLLDAEDYGPGARLTIAERGQKRRALREKEHDLARALGDRGNGIGVEYLRSAHQEAAEQLFGESDQRSAGQRDEIKDASSFGLVRSGADAVNLDPISGRRSKNEAVGWSKAFKRGWSPSATTRSPSPKKARFMLDGKGMRTPGADSSHEERLRSAEAGRRKKRDANDDDDDDLELV